MSQTQSVTYKRRGFGAYDVAVGVFLKYLIDAAEAGGEANASWLSETTSQWRVWAVVGECGFPLDERWSAEQQKTFINLVEKTCASLATRNAIPAQEIVSWPFVDNMRIDPRGAKEVLTAPVVELGRAIIALLRDELPEAAEGEAWFFGAPTGRSTIRMDDSWDGRWA